MTDRDVAGRANEQSDLLLQRRTARILAVDDEGMVSAVVARWLTDEGYHCETASTAEKALAVLAEKPFELLISDIRMPSMSGLELLADVAERFPDVGVIMATGVDDRATAIRCLELGAFGYVIKPLDKDELLINVANALERRRLALDRSSLFSFAQNAY